MAGKKTAVFGIYATVGQAERAVDALVLIIFRTPTCPCSCRTTRARGISRTRSTRRRPRARRPASAAGGTIGGTLGLLAGIGALAIPGVGPFIAAGPIMGALAGLGVGGAVGGLVGALVGMGIPEYEAKRYEGRVKNGGVLLSVHCDTSEEITRAKNVLKQTGAEDIASSDETSVGRETAAHEPTRH